MDSPHQPDLDINLRKLLSHQIPNNISYPEKFSHHLIVRFYPFKNKNKLLSGNPPSYQNKLLEPGIQRVTNNKKYKFGLNGDLFDKTYTHYNEILDDNQEPHC